MNLVRQNNSDFYLRLVTFALLAFGFIMVASSSTNYSTYYLNDPWFFTFRQGIWIFVGFICMVVCSRLSPSFIEKYSIWYFGACIMMLLLVLFFGEERNGAKSWFSIGSFGIQPTEFAKLAVIIGMAKLISKRKELFSDYRKGLIPSVIMIVVIAGLIMGQPDFGSTLIICAATLVMLFIGGVRFRHLSILLIVTAVFMTIYITYLVAQDSYKIDRYMAFVNPFADKEGAGYQLVQSLYAFGHGGFTGVGFGESVQKLPMFLPMAYNDFIFPIIGEEFGLIGVFLFFAVFLAFLGRSLVLSLKCNNMFLMLCGVGIVVMISLQAIVNIGGVTGSMPMTGVTLPFISYGGSSIITTMICVGLLLNISRRIKREKKNTEPESQ